MGTPASSQLRQVAGRVHPPQVFSTIGLDHHRRFGWWGRVTFPEEEFFAVAFEADFYEVRHDGWQMCPAAGNDRATVESGWLAGKYGRRRLNQ